jgi:hypothetical protein
MQWKDDEDDTRTRKIGVDLVGEINDTKISTIEDYNLTIMIMRVSMT